MIIVRKFELIIIFALSAFEPVDEELDWTLVYPELANGQARKKVEKIETPSDAQGLLSQKLDAMLKEAKKKVMFFHTKSI